jgi:hypothetical protein
MTTPNCEQLVHQYVDWLRQRMSAQAVRDVCEITTPFVDRHNDQIQIYVRGVNGHFLLTDDGYTVRDLKMSGCEFNSEKRRQLLNATLNGFGIKMHGDELTVEARPDNFPQKKHNLMQAMLAVNDMFAMASPIVQSLFREDVEHYLRSKEIRFTPSVKFTGKSEFDHFFDFVIPASRSKPERILKAINHPNRQNITSLIFSWNDTREVRAVDSTAYAVLNDMNDVTNPDLFGALDQYGIRSMRWSRREEYV